MRPTRVLLTGSAMLLGLVCIAGGAQPRTDLRYCQLIKEKRDTPKTKSITGKLRSIESSTLTVIPAGKEPMTLAIDSGTKITVDGKQAALTALEKGQRVTCTYVARLGKNICLSVDAQAAEKE